MTTPTIEEALQQVLDSAVPNKCDNPKMFAAWEVARAALKNNRPSSPIADRLADGLREEVEAAGAYAGILQNFNADPKLVLERRMKLADVRHKVRVILAEYDTQRSSDHPPVFGYHIAGKKPSDYIAEQFPATVGNLLFQDWLRWVDNTMRHYERSSADGWVSAEERLPEVGETVFVYVPGHGGGSVAAIYNHEFKIWSSRPGLHSVSGVTHWKNQDLPQPPKGATT